VESGSLALAVKEWNVERFRVGEGLGPRFREDDEMLVLSSEQYG